MKICSLQWQIYRITDFPLFETCDYYLDQLTFSNLIIAACDLFDFEQIKNYSAIDLYLLRIVTFGDHWVPKDLMFS